MPLASDSVLSGIKSLVSCFTFCGFTLVSRSANTAADWLVKRALKGTMFPSGDPTTQAAVEHFVALDISFS